jgi:hypothetical protein
LLLTFEVAYKERKEGRKEERKKERRSREKKCFFAVHY